MGACSPLAGDLALPGLAACLIALLVSLPAASAAPTCVPDLPKTATQGGLVVARIDPSCTIEFGGRPVRVDPDGTFVFGLGRDAPATATLTVRAKDGTRTRAKLAVAQRKYAIERIRGVPPDTVTPPPAIAERIAREQAEVAAARTRDDARQDFRFGIGWPLKGRISGVYGSQRILNDIPKDPHYGLDIAAPTGTLVKAPAAGVVSFAKPDLYLTGGTVLLDHGHGVSSAFIHMSRLDVQAGDRIEQGQVIGAVGMTGRASGPHLHWGMNWFDTRIDPQLLLPPPG